jgi:hypothetical protein
MAITFCSFTRAWLLPFCENPRDYLVTKEATNFYYKAEKCILPKKKGPNSKITLRSKKLGIKL